MKRLNWRYLSVIMFIAVGLTACGSDNDEPGVGPIDPGASVDDPVGTVELSMMKSSGSNKTYLGNSNIYINDSYNFAGGSIVSLGKVNGLGNVSHIPTEGWASSVAVNPGYGYVAYSNGAWYRIFVVKEIGGTSGGVIGYKVKYQTPFKGIDEAISFEQESLTFDAKGGTVNVLFKNKYIVPFTIKVESGAEWCHVQTCSSYDQYFLANGVSVRADPTKSAQKSDASVTLTTLYGKSKSFKVVRSGSEPYIELGLSEHTIDARKQEVTTGFSSNCEISDLNITSSETWCKPEIIDRSAALKANIVKYIGDSPVNETTTRAASESGVKSYELHLNVDENLENDARIAEVIIKPKAGKQSAGMSLTQKKGQLEFYKNSEKPFEINGGAGTSNISFNTSTKVENLEVKSDASWCTPVIKGYTVQITYLENSGEKSRKCKVTLSAKGGTLKDDLEVNQIAHYLRPAKSKIYFSKNSNYESIVLATDFATVEPLSDVSWCILSYNVAAKTVTLRVEQNTGEERTAIISFKNSSAVMKVIQSKYEIGDDYSENGVVGTVKYMQDSIRLVVSEDLGKFVWSTENVATGATDRYDGRKNMDIIQKIPNWKVLYPAFAAVETLNTGGVTGWYLPAYEECRYIRSLNNWSSTEYDVSRTYNYGSYQSKSALYSVIGVYRF